MRPQGNANPKTLDGCTVTTTWKGRALRFLGRYPKLAEWDWKWRLRKVPLGKGSAQFLAARLAAWVEEALPLVEEAPRDRGKDVVLFTLHDTWLLHNSLLAIALAGRGHRVTLLFWPYRDWFTPISDYALWQREAYLRHILRPLARIVEVRSLLREPPGTYPPDLEPALEEVDAFDMQYALQREEVAEDHPLWRVRRARNRDAARRLWHFLTQRRPQALLVPNGLILEFGVAYHVGRRLGLPVMTFEFDEQKDYMWLSQQDPVMRLNVDDLWARYRHQPLTPEEAARIRRAMEDRWQGRVWERSPRQWQDVPPQGSLEVARKLGLDPKRPLFLLAPNVFGDSVVLGAQVFTRGLTDWVKRTLDFFARHPEAQLVIRVHPGEKLLDPQGLSMAQVVREAWPARAKNIVLIPADAPINTFDLVPLATAGLVYTSTIGMEMVLQGVPVVVAGRAFYRGKGFTLDPDTWDAYWDLLRGLLTHPQAFAPTPEQQELAWRFAYAFFYRFPRPYPWNLIVLPQLMEHPERHPARVLRNPLYFPTWDQLVGEPLPWRVPEPVSA